MEGVAHAQFAYKSLLVPGQLQTPDYAAALLVGNLRVPPMEAPQVARARVARQRIADDACPLRFRAVLEEYVLDRIVGGPAVMRPQLQHLLDMGRRDNVDIHIMPVSVAVHDGLDGDYLILDFEDAQSIGYVEYPTGAIYVQDQDQVSAYTLSADRLCSAALSTSESADLIAERMQALTPKSE